MSFNGRVEDLNKNRLVLAAMLLTAVLAATAVYYLLPLASGIVFGVFFFFVTRPIKQFLDRYTRYSPYLATFCLVLPFIALAAYGAFTVWGEVQWAMGHGQELSAIVDRLEADLALPFDLSNAINEALMRAYDYAIAYLKTISIRGALSGLASLAMNALISIFVCFYLLKDGGSFVNKLRELAPAGGRPALDTFLAEADRLLSGIYTGTFYTALFVAAGSLAVFFFFGIPYKALLTAFVFIAAMVPILSGMMVFIPVAVYIYLYRSPLMAALFLGTAIVFVYLPPDFIIRPYLINRASDLHPLLIILAFIGGGVAGGVSGFFAAPLAIGLLTAAYRTYKKMAKEE